MMRIPLNEERSMRKLIAALAVIGFGAITAAAGACEYGKVAQTSKPTATAEAPITPAPTPKTGG
jgi:hypothetical protein